MFFFRAAHDSSTVRVVCAFALVACSTVTAPSSDLLTATELYGSDGYHPGPLGTYLAALVIYERVTGKDARQLPGTAIVARVPLPVPEETVRLLQQVAHETVARFQ